MRAIGGTASEPFSQIYATLISAIRSAESSHLPRQCVLRSRPAAPRPRIEDAARRGVDVKLLLPSVSDSWLVLAAGRRHYGDLLRGRREDPRARGALLHSKTTVIDGVWSTVGSTNLDWRSFLHNDEINAVVLSPFGEQMKTAFEKDLEASKSLTLDDLGTAPADLPRSGNQRRHMGVSGFDTHPRRPP